LRALAGLLHREVLLPKGGQSVLDTLDENSHKHAFAVPTDLEYGAGKAIELIADEAIRHVREVSKDKLFGDEELARKLTRESLMYLYRLLFLFYVEARGAELEDEEGNAVVPMKSDVYCLGYSRETLRDLELVSSPAPPPLPRGVREQRGHTDLSQQKRHSKKERQIMLELSAASIVVASALARAIGKTLVPDDDDLTGVFSQNLVDAITSQNAIRALVRKLEALGVKSSTQKKLTKDITAIEVAGIAWTQLLAEQDESDLRTAFGQAYSERIWRRLDPTWFSNTLHSNCDAMPVIAGFESSGILSHQHEAFVVSTLSAAIADEFDTGIDQQMQSFLTRLTKELPAKTQDLLSGIPSLQLTAVFESTKRTAQISARTHEIISGRTAHNTCNDALAKAAARLVASRNDDVFSRRQIAKDDLQQLPLARIYVEPCGRIRDDADEFPVKQLIQRQFREHPDEVVVLAAQFGFGKSLTCRSMAIDLAEEFLADPTDAPFPVLVRCPDILSGHVRSLKTALERFFETELELKEGEVATILSSYQLVLMLDSFDEVVLDQSAAKAWIEEMQNFARRKNIFLLLASRPTAYESQWLKRSGTTIEIQPFNRKQVETWLGAARGVVTDSPPSYEDLASAIPDEILGTPILLLMTVWSGASSNKLPTSKAAVYSEFLRKISMGKWSDLQAPHPVVERGAEALATAAGQNAFIHALALVAWESLCASQDQRGALTRRSVEDLLTGEFPTLDSQHLSEVLQSIVLSMFLKPSQVDSSELVFTHQSFREYLAAAYLHRVLADESTGKNLLSATLAEAELGQEEVSFFCDMLRCESAKKRILNMLDRQVDDNRLLIFHQPGKTHWDSVNSKMVFRAERGANRAETLRSNAERLAIGIRNITVKRGPLSFLHRRGRLFGPYEDLEQPEFLQKTRFVCSAMEYSLVASLKEEGLYHHAEVAHCYDRETGRRYLVTQNELMAKSGLELRGALGHFLLDFHEEGPLLLADVDDYEQGTLGEWAGNFRTAPAGKSIIEEILWLTHALRTAARAAVGFHRSTYAYARDKNDVRLGFLVVGATADDVDQASREQLAWWLTDLAERSPPSLARRVEGGRNVLDVCIELAELLASDKDWLDIEPSLRGFLEDVRATAVVEESE
jgi:hypothetical protein